MALKFLNDGYFAGKVGIGTASPTSKLDIRQSTSGGSDVLGTGAINIGSDNPYWTLRGTATSLQDLAFDRNYSGTWYESMRIQRSTGNVGIGTNNPGGKLDVAYTGTGGTGTKGIGEGLNITSFTPNVTFNDTSSNVDNYAVHLNQNVFTIGRYTSATAQNPDLVLKSGNVGIGTINPVSPLTIKSNSVSSGESGIVIQANGNTNSIIKLGERGGDGGRFEMLDANVAKIALYTDGTDNYINAGNVGIGITNPSSKLHISKAGGVMIKLGTSQNT
ncbi:MAG: hypothetical protein GY787_13790, partial [Alteromonadales bacterium]|nr:hypothetical protein [Alteromonadales bacterium]